MSMLALLLLLSAACRRSWKIIKCNQHHTYTVTLTQTVGFHFSWKKRMQNITISLNMQIWTSKELTVLISFEYGTMAQRASALYIHWSCSLYTCYNETYMHEIYLIFFLYYFHSAMLCRTYLPTNQCTVGRKQKIQPKSTLVYVNCIHFNGYVLASCIKTA